MTAEGFPEAGDRIWWVRGGTLHSDIIRSEGLLSVVTRGGCVVPRRDMYRSEPRNESFRTVLMRTVRNRQ